MAGEESRCEVCGKRDDRFDQNNKYNFCYAAVEGKVAIVCLACKQALAQKKKRQRNGF